MYRNVRQQGFIPVLQSFGPAPLEHWAMKVENGCIRRVTDEQVRALAFDIASPNVSTCFLRCPREPRGSLGIHLKHLVMIIKGMNKYFTFEVTILDDRNVRRRFRMSNFERCTRVHYFDASMPLCLRPGWNEIYFDLAEFTRKAYKTNFVEVIRLQIHANCRIRVIYFCDKMYDEKDVPQKLKIFLPTEHVSRKRSVEEVPVKKTAESLLQLVEFEDEEAEEEMYPSLKSIQERGGEKPSSKPPSLHRPSFIGFDDGEHEGILFDDDIGLDDMGAHGEPIIGMMEDIEPDRAEEEGIVPASADEADIPPAAEEESVPLAAVKEEPTDPADEDEQAEPPAAEDESAEPNGDEAQE